MLGNQEKEEGPLSFTTDPLFFVYVAKFRRTENMKLFLSHASVAVPPRRYGWTSNMSTAILRHTSHENCAKNMTGFITVSHVKVEEEYDALCFDENGNDATQMRKDTQKCFYMWLTPTFSLLTC